MKTCPYSVAAAINNYFSDEQDLFVMAVDLVRSSEEYSDFEINFFERNKGYDQEVCDAVIDLADLIMCTEIECGKYYSCKM